MLYAVDLMMKMFIFKNSFIILFYIFNEYLGKV